MLKHLLLILSAVAIMAADTNENTNGAIRVTTKPIVSCAAIHPSGEKCEYVHWDGGDYAAFSNQDYWNSITNVTWTIDQTGTNEVSVSIGTNSTVTWLPVERSGQMQKEVGFTQTNRILTIIHQGKTNLVGIAVIGREEWPSQKRTQKIPTQPKAAK
jgi:hypothetical protein